MLIDKQLKAKNKKTSAFEGDSYILNEIEELIQTYKISNFVETGTNTAKTTVVAANMFCNVHTIELNEEFYLNCKQILSSYKNVSIHNGSSEQIMNQILPKFKGRTLFFL